MATNNVIVVMLFIAMVTMFVASNVVVVVAQDEQDPLYKECYENGIKLENGKKLDGMKVDENVQRACESIVFDLEH
ncbi:hypothetical protein KY285_007058 [Solanum tuberosum]|nr:hypothetical protein KY289_007493 [Solanum tuberosum]KAH0745401.1 hypothetical protein KY285_007058 [Solanum tuberosum]